MNLQFFGWKVKPAFIVIAILTLLSIQIVSTNAIFPNVPLRMELQNSILTGSMEPPYQYRLVKPFLGYVLQMLTSIFISDPQLSHAVSYQIISIIAFFLIYVLMNSFFNFFFTETTAIMGMILFFLVIPLGMTGVWEEGDYFTVFFYLAGLNLIFRSKEIYLPVIIAAGAFNREQIIFLVVFYLCYAIGKKKLFKTKTIIVASLSVAAWLAVFFLTRNIFGFKSSHYTVEWNTSENIREIPKIIFLWSVLVLPFATAGILTFKKSSVFFKCAFVSVGIYIIIFFFNGFLTQMAKFLPAYLIFIPMFLQLITGEDTQKKTIADYPATS